MGEPRWLPLESNPDVMNKYIKGLGVPDEWKFQDIFDLTEDGLKAVPRPVPAVLLLFPLTEQYVQNLGVPAAWQFTDVYGFEPDLLAFVPKPIAAVLLLYPISEKSEATPVGTEEPGVLDQMFFMKQTVGNACGTVGLIHAILNNTEQLQLDAEKHLKKFLDTTKSMTPEERGKYLETDSAFGAAHEESAQEGQTAAPSRDEHVKGHFVAFVHHNGGLYELDGRKDAPIHHGNTTADALLEDAAAVVKKFMARDPEELNFTVVALAKV